MTTTSAAVSSSRLSSANPRASPLLFHSAQTRSQQRRPAGVVIGRSGTSATAGEVVVTFRSRWMAAFLFASAADW